MPATYVRVNLAAIASNVRMVLNRLDGSQLMAVVKGNAYGHGMVPVAKQCVTAGAHWLGVSYVDEAMRLRAAGVTAPTLAFVPPTEEQCQTAVAQDITVTITTEDHLLTWAGPARAMIWCGFCRSPVDFRSLRSLAYTLILMALTPAQYAVCLMSSSLAPNYKPLPRL